MKYVTVILVLAYLLVLPQAIMMFIYHRSEPEKYGMGLKYRLPWFIHFISIWLIMPWFMLKYHVIDKLK